MNVVSFTFVLFAAQFVGQVFETQKVTRDIRRDGGIMLLEYHRHPTESSPYGFREGNRAPLPNWLRHWGGAELKYHLFPVVCVILDFPRVDDDTLQAITRLPDVEVVHILTASVTDDGLATLADIERLEFLTLNLPELSDAGLAHVASIDALRWLRLDNGRYTDEGLMQLRSLSNLELLMVDTDRVTEDGIRELQKELPECRIEYFER